MVARIRRLVPILLLGLSVSTPALAEDISGTTCDARTDSPLEAAAVMALEPGMTRPVAVAHTDTAGHFQFRDLPAGSYTLVITRIGYRVLRVDEVVAGDPGAAQLFIRLEPSPIFMDPVVVTASRRREPGLKAPASISIVDRTRIEEAAGLTPVDVVRTATGVDFASKGIIQHTFAVRGSRSANSAAVLLLTDYRYAAVPSLGLNISYLLSPVRDDVDHIELMRGPGAALYGPDTDRGVLHILTRSPLESTGTRLSVTGGERSVVRTSFRHAGRLSERLGYKISSEYFRGNDWEFTDPVEAQGRGAALEAGADPDTLLIGKRNFNARRAAGEMRLDWQPAPGTSLVLDAGVAQAINAVDITPTAGAIQVRDWRYSYLQARVRKDRLFVNLMHNMSDAGDTYFLQSGLPVIDTSRMSAAQFQHGTDLGKRYRLLYGVDMRRTEPRTGGTIHGRNETNDTMSEVGTYLHANSAVLPSLDIVTALRADYHDRINSLAVSPRAGAVYHPGDTHVFRLVYNRAFNSPSPVDLFADFQAQSAGPFGVRVSAIPRSGFSFSRDPDCGCLTMRVPGQPGPIPADATLAWPGLVEALLAQGVDLRNIPAPSGSEVGTELRALDLERGGFLIPVSPGDLGDLKPLRRQVTNAIELGYKGVIGQRMTVGLDVYHNRVSNATGTLFAGTPNVFLDRATLEAYLAGLPGFTPDSAAAVAELLSGIPTGTIAPREAGDSADILLLTRQGGAYSNVGVDLNLELRISRRFSGRANYSWIRRNVFNDVDQIGTVVLGAPRNKGMLAVDYRDVEAGVTGSIQGRAVQSFPVVNGLYRGTVDSYAVIDLDAGYRLSWERRARLSLNVSNLFDHRHREFVGVPEVGRLILGRIDFSFQAE